MIFIYRFKIIPIHLAFFLHFISATGFTFLFCLCYSLITFKLISNNRQNVHVYLFYCLTGVFTILKPITDILSIIYFLQHRRNNASCLKHTFHLFLCTIRKSHGLFDIPSFSWFLFFVWYD